MYIGLYKTPNKALSCLVLSYCPLVDRFSVIDCPGFLSWRSRSLLHVCFPSPVALPVAFPGHVWLY